MIFQNVPHVNLVVRQVAQSLEKYTRLSKTVLASSLLTNLPLANKSSLIILFVQLVVAVSAAMASVTHLVNLLLAPRKIPTVVVACLLMLPLVLFMLNSKLT